MRKFMLCILAGAMTCLLYGQNDTMLKPKKVSTYKGASFKLLSLEYFDYNKRFKGRQVLGGEGAYPCLKGTMMFSLPLEETPTSVQKTAVVTEALTDRGIPLIINEEDREDAVKNYMNAGKMVFYLEQPTNKDRFISVITGKALFSVPVREQDDTVKKFHTCPWFEVEDGNACILVLNKDNNHTVYAVLRYPPKKKQNPSLLKLYLLDNEADEKNIMWHHTTFTDSAGTSYLVYQATVFFEKKENFCFLINDKDYQIKNIIGPPFLSSQKIHAFLMNKYPGKKSSHQVYLLTLPETRPRQYNWAYLNLSNTRNLFSLKNKNDAVIEKEKIAIKEFTNIPNKYTIEYLGIFQAKSYRKKSVPFRFENIPIAEE